jgi:hypothetical protein
VNYNTSSLASPFLNFFWAALSRRDPYRARLFLSVPRRETAKVQSRLLAFTSIKADSLNGAIAPMRTRVRFVVLFVAPLFLGATSAWPATLTVNSSADAGGTCPGATCTLRQAILSAGSGDTVNFAAGITTINLTSAELSINKNLTITGPGANLLTVQRSTANAFRVFGITGSFNVTISGITITGGYASDQASGGGGISNSGAMLTVTDCVVLGNGAENFYGGSGGGIYNFNGGTATIINSKVSNNSASRGGGIVNSGGTLRVTRCTLDGNTAYDYGGGGIVNNGGGTVNLSNSTLAGNATCYSCSASGGGLLNSSGTVNISNSTLSGNSALHGGGIANSGTLNIISSTITGNSATTASRASGGGIAGIANARNTIIAGNSAFRNPDFDGELTSQGFNLIGNNSGATITPTTGDQIGTAGSPIDPKLGPLQDNGGPTFTEALLSGSPALDKGQSSGSNMDQRGFPRPVDLPGIANAAGGDGSDIGAFESQTDPNPAKSLNLSTRARVLTGDNVMIGGFIVTGKTSKKVILRAIGPSVSKSGLTGVLADPVLELRGPDGSVLLANDNWKDNPDQALLIQASGIPPQNDLESAIVATLPPATYTAIISGKSNGTGLGLVEVYDLDQTSDSRLANMSTRAVVGTGDNVVIGGFILGNNNVSPQIIIRALGPSLSRFGIANPLADPTLELRDGNGMLIAFDDNWKDNSTQAAQITAAGLQPPNDLEAAIAMTLPPGTYTSIVAGKNGGIGVGIVEVYNLQ